MLAAINNTRLRPSSTSKSVALSPFIRHATCGIVELKLRRNHPDANRCGLGVFLQDSENARFPQKGPVIHGATSGLEPLYCFSRPLHDRGAL
jgi:hypothetical protein